MKGDADLNAQFFEETLVYMNKYERLERYSWFTDRWTHGQPIKIFINELHFLIKTEI